MASPIVGKVGARSLSLAALLATLGLLAYGAVGQGCSSEPSECTKDSECTSATTGCTVGVCKDSKCNAQPVADGTRYSDQSSVKDKPCVVLKCKGGVATEFPDGSKTGPDLVCQKASCDNLTLKITNIMDGVPCEGGGACGGGKCLPPVDAGPKVDTGAPVDTGAADDTGTTDDAAAD